MNEEIITTAIFYTCAIAGGIAFPVAVAFAFALAI